MPSTAPPLIDGQRNFEAAKAYLDSKFLASVAGSFARESLLPNPKVNLSDIVSIAAEGRAYVKAATWLWLGVKAIPVFFWASSWSASASA